MQRCPQRPGSMAGSSVAAGSVTGMTTTLTAKSPEDILAAVPVVLGFCPEDSLVMLTFGGREQFHARLDLPAGPDAIPECVDTVLRPASAHGVAAVVFVLYSADAALVRRLSRELRRAFEASGIRVIDCLRVHDGRWFAPGGRAGVPDHGVPYDVSDHEFRAKAVYDGRVTFGSRAELAARVAADPELVAETQEALAEATALSLSGVVGVVSRSLPAGRVADVDDLASLLLALLDPRLREQAWAGLRREEAAAHVALWSDVVRRAPEHLVGHPAAILAFVAWLHGDGALAWCALDRCLAADPDNRLGAMIGRVLAEAVSPSTWAECADA